MICYFCEEEIFGYRAVAFVFVGEERVPLHLSPCLQRFQELQQEPRGSDDYSQWCWRIP